jgi:hypothetical protein
MATSRVRYPQSVGGWPRNGTVIGRPGGPGLGLAILAAIAASFSGPGGGPPFNPFKPRNPFGDDNDSTRRDYRLHAPPLPRPRIVFNQSDAAGGDARNNDEISRGIAGHAGEHFPGLTEDEIAERVKNVLDNPNSLKLPLASGRTKYYNDGTIVIRNPRVPYGGTAHPGHF